MRTWTVFIVVGLILVGVVVALSYNKQVSQQHPAALGTQQLLAAIKAQDAAALGQILETTTCAVETGPDGKLAAVRFGALTLRSAFTNYPAITWRIADLQRLQEMSNLPPEVDEESGSATVRVEPGYMVYFQRRDGVWRIVYIAKPSERNQ